MAEARGGVSDKSLAAVEPIIKKYKGKKEFLICILQDIQAEYGYLSRDALKIVSEKLDISLIQIYGVATFFKAFRLTPRGEHLIQVCLGTACHVRGSDKVLDKIKRTLDMNPGESKTNDKMSFSLETVNCLGACALGPAVVIDGKTYGHMTSAKVEPILKKYYIYQGGK
jgi:NADH-quinone oxidoreductase subunit E